MALWKQALVACVAALVAFAAWIVIAPQTAPSFVADAANRVGLPLGGTVESAGGPPGRGGGPGGPPGGGRGGPPGGFGGGGGPQSVVVAPARAATDTARVSAIGTAEAMRSVVLNAPDDGLVREIAIAPGRNVAAGDVLVVLDDREQRLALTRSEIALRTAREGLERVEQLASRQAAAGVQLDDARAAVERAESDLASAELALERRSLIAPFAGTLGLAQIEIGQRVTTQTPAVALDDRSRILVRFAVPEAFAGRVRPQDAVSARTAAYPGLVFEGRIDEIDSRVDPGSRALTLRAGFDNADDALRPGMSFTIDLVFDGAPRVAVPAAALQWDRDGPYVWRVAGETVSRVRVEIASRGAGEVLVTGSIEAGDAVVLEGVQRLREGSPVTIAGEGEVVATPGRRS